MQQALAQAAQSLAEAFKRFPEFIEISLQSVMVDHPTDEGDFISSLEPLLMARRADGDWQGLEESADVCAMNDLIDWTGPVRSAIFRATRWGAPIVFEREQMTVEAIEQKLAEGVRQVPRLPAAGLSVG